MARRRPAFGMASLVASMGAGADADELTTRVLDAAAVLLTDYGLRRWSMDDVADRAGVGRTSLYRKFAGRDELVYAVLAREVRAAFAAITEAAAHFESLEDKVVEGALVALALVEDSLVARLIQSDPATFLPFLTTEAGPLVALARELLVSQAVALGAEVDREEAAELSELAARLGLSFILTRATVFPTDDQAAARRTLQRVLGPILAPLAAPPGRRRESLPV
ncbi:MAG TPA: TetR family transcriptional regulator [Acidimicrobiales bacterium]|jgi:AcrR family transcriptional regulator|nr:TetR family transcriptional regulator [Acidimicrobiales bacterium]